MLEPGTGVKCIEADGGGLYMVSTDGECERECGPLDPEVVDCGRPIKPYWYGCGVGVGEGGADGRRPHCSECLWSISGAFSSESVRRKISCRLCQRHHSMVTIIIRPKNPPNSPPSRGPSALCRETGVDDADVYIVVRITEGTSELEAVLLINTVDCMTTGARAMSVGVGVVMGIAQHGKAVSGELR